MKVVLTVIVVVLALVTNAVAIEPTKVDFSAKPTWTPNVLTYGYHTDITLQQWLSTRPAEANALALYPGFKEPERDKESNGTITRVKEEQTIFVSRSTFVVEKPMSAINLQNIATLDAIKKIDVSFEHQQISPNQLFKKRSDGKPHNQLDSRPWCASAGTICLQSKWGMPVWMIPLFKGAMLALGKDGKDTFQETQSEVSVIAAPDLAKYSALIGSVPAGGIEQNIFYVNQIMRWGKNVVLLQPGANNSTNVTVFSVIAVASEYWKKKVGDHRLRDYLLMNKFNKGCDGGLLAGMEKLSSCAGTNLLEILKN